MKYSHRLLSFSFILFTFSKGGAETLHKFRLGWQVPWATQGQLVQIFKHTDILKKHHLEAEFVGRTFGPQLNELALANEVDVILTADQPALTLFSKDKGWLSIGRLMYNRTSTYVPPSSKITSIKELKNKKIGLPMGAAAERITVEALKNAGIEPSKDVTLINLDIKEQAPLILKEKDKPTWDSFDALAGFDPLPAILEAKGLIRVIDVGTVVSLIVTNSDFIKNNPSFAKNFLAAFQEAYLYYGKNTKQANQWFSEEAHLDGADEKALTIAASLEPNLKAKTSKDLRIAFSEDDYKIIQKAADFLEPKLGKKIEFKKYLDDSIAKSIK